MACKWLEKLFHCDTKHLTYLDDFVLAIDGMRKSINELKESIGDAAKANALSTSRWKASKSAVDVLQKQLIQAEQEKNDLQKRWNEEKEQKTSLQSQLNDAQKNTWNQIHCKCGGTAVNHQHPVARRHGSNYIC